MRIVHFAALLLVPVSVGAADHWFQWRGPNNDGMATGGAPIEWSETRNIAWRVPIAGRGHSSPVIWGDRIFLTTAVPTSPLEEAEAESGGRAGGGAGAGREHRFVVLCLDRHTGATIWERVATVDTPHEGYHRRYGSFASNTPVTDGEYLYAFFGSRGLYTYDLDGELIWQKRFPPMNMRLAFGEGVAAVVDEEALFLKFDQEGSSFMVALNKRTGEEIWRVSRDEPSSWSPPLVLTHNGVRQVVVSASNKVQAYDPASGRVIWEASGLGTNVIPAPVTNGELVFVMSGHRNPNLLAIQLGREGDLTGTDAIVWTNSRGNSYTASPVIHDDKLYILTDSGMLSCLDAKTGEPYYQQQRLPNPYNFKASPIGADGRLYLASEEEDVIVVKMGEEFEVLAINTLPGQTFIASPAIAEGSLYLRSQEALYCIRE